MLPPESSASDPGLTVPRIERIDSTPTSPDSPVTASPRPIRSIDLQQQFPIAAAVSDIDYVDYTLTHQSPEQRSHVRDLEKLKEGHRQRMELATLIVTGCVLALLAGACLYVVVSNTNPDVQKIAAGGLVSLFTAWLGYAAGRGSVKSS